MFFCTRWDTLRNEEGDVPPELDNFSKTFGFDSFADLESKGCVELVVLYEDDDKKLGAPRCMRFECEYANYLNARLHASMVFDCIDACM